MGFRVEIFCAFDEDESGWEIDSPGKCGSGYHDLHIIFDEQLLAEFSITIV